MSAHTAFRLAARPIQRASFLPQLAAAAAQKRLSHRPQICLRCSIAVRLGTGPGRTRLFSTSPPPPRQPPPWQPGPEDGSTTPEPESTTPKDASSTAASPSSPAEQSEQHPQPEPAPTTPPCEPPSPEPTAEPDSTPPQPDQTAQTELPSQQDPSLPSFTETHRHPLSARFSTFMDNLQSRAVTATQTLNDLTGYSAIEAIKSRNTQLETEHAASQTRLRAARHDYKALTSHRAATQREVTTLLARKDTWNPTDLERFTTLYRLDHELETHVAAAAAELTDAETDEARLSGELNAGILKRYHEEQIWSDRIRRQSTWGTWGLMGVNILLFLVLQFVAEPWRRRRLVNGIAESEKGVMEEVRRELGAVKAALEASGLREREAAAVAAAAAEAAALASAPVEEVAFDGSGEGAAVASPEIVALTEAEQWDVPRKAWREVLAEFWEDPELLREAVLDLSSDRRVDLRMRDASLIALQGAAAGATVAVVLAFSLLRST
ncbi:Mdm33 family-domain-containing protein [Parachaetomium inaequale]|uniref:Sensitive to high expression protein 9, mitochondrial n=1 Tax=Parachaetomium inaequale TaxID=2588326 RepID=A0AAN6PA00_9PEZI|nr:Mdm33 family-domain-containing protein [Parachaetomium inaequale]